MNLVNEYPKLSIVTPSYNQAEYIEDAIKSVLIQNYPKFEHIIIDNCSTDNTLDILKKYTHLKWISEPDKGQSDAFNKGVGLANGELIGWLNSDDFFLQDAFKKIAEIFKRTRSDVLYGSYIFVDKYGKFIKLMPALRKNSWLLTNYGCYIPSSGAFFLSEIVKNYLINKELKVVMDQDLYIRLDKSCKKFLKCKEYLSVFRIHQKNQSKILMGTETVELFNKYGTPNIFNLDSELWFKTIRILSHIYFYIIRLISGNYVERLINNKNYKNKNLRWFNEKIDDYSN